MRSPYHAAAPSSASTAIAAGITAGIALIILTAAALFLLQSSRHLIPPEVLDGLTSPARFGPRTT